MPNRPEKPNKDVKVEQAPKFNRNVILDLTSALKRFKPVLVNEKHTGEYEAADSVVCKESIPTRDEMITLAGNAVFHLNLLIKEHEALKQKYADLYADGVQAHAAIADLGIKAFSITEGIDTIIGRHKHALTVIKKVSENGTKETVFEAIRPACAFAEDMERKGMKAGLLVNENKENGPQVDSAVIELPRQDS